MKPATLITTLTITLQVAVVCAALAGLTGCAVTPDSIVMEPTTQKPSAPVIARQANGAIFQNGAYRPMFEDRRARMVGDILTITIAEKTSAAKTAASSGSKAGSTSFGVTKLLGAPSTTTADLAAAANNANKFEDKGAVSSTNTFTGTIGVTVIEVLENGNLIVSGEKQVSLDKGTEYIRFSGVVSPDNIATGNIVSSTQVADARVEYRTNTRIDKSEMSSMMSRFFYSLLPL
ncbi:flagellar basal body L-ring protein FlgH [soil metagenome]